MKINRPQNSRKPLTDVWLAEAMRLYLEQAKTGGKRSRATISINEACRIAFAALSERTKVLQTTGHHLLPLDSPDALAVLETCFEKTKGGAAFQEAVRASLRTVGPDYVLKHEGGTLALAIHRDNLPAVAPEK